jgi:hypothetical protein
VGNQLKPMGDKGLVRTSYQPKGSMADSSAISKQMASNTRGNS